MVSTPNPLWERIERYQTDEPGHAFPFSAKLADEQGWSRTFTQRAIFEYKRFVYLCCISPQGASPPPVVDEVWHLHLTYTRSYWQDFCTNCLRQELHHQPSAGGPGESQRHRDWYADTLQLYEQTFDAPPPTDIWPPAAAAAEPRNSDRLPRSRISLALLVTGAVCMLPAYRASGPIFLLCFALFLAYCSLLRWIHFIQVSKTLGSYILDDLPLNLPDLAWLSGNRQRVRQLVAADGLRRNIFQYESGAWHVDTGLLQRENPFYASWFAGRERLTTNEFLGIVDAESSQQAYRFDPLKRWLEADPFPQLLYAVPIILGGGRIIQGLLNDRPVLFLMLELGLYLQYIARIQNIPGFHRSLSRSIDAKPALVADLSAMGVSGAVILYGMSALTSEPEFRNLGPTVLADWEEPRRSWSESGVGDSGGCASSSCSSGSCGSGCGGCGGGD